MTAADFVLIIMNVMMQISFLLVFFFGVSFVTHAVGARSEKADRGKSWLERRAERKAKKGEREAITEKEEVERAPAANAEARDLAGYLEHGSLEIPDVGKNDKFNYRWRHVNKRLDRTAEILHSLVGEGYGNVIQNKRVQKIVKEMMEFHEEIVSKTNANNEDAISLPHHIWNKKVEELKEAVKEASELAA